MAGKFYGVVGGRNGDMVYTTWKEAEENVRGVKGVRYKGFATRSEAEGFITSGGDYGTKVRAEVESPSGVRTISDNDRRAAEVPSGEYMAYVDGSYKEGRICYGYGLVILKDGVTVYEEKGAYDREEFVSMRNVAGEVEASMAAMKYAIGNGISKIHIFYDYMGLECWALGTWKRNNDLTKGYHEFYRDMTGKRGLKVIFHKVKGHSGDHYNDRADALAKAAVDEHCS